MIAQAYKVPKYKKISSYFTKHSNHEHHIAQNKLDAVKFEVKLLQNKGEVTRRTSKSIAGRRTEVRSEKGNYFGKNRQVYFDLCIRT